MNVFRQLYSHAAESIGELNQSLQISRDALRIIFTLCNDFVLHVFRIYERVSE